MAQGSTNFISPSLIFAPNVGAFLVRSQKYNLYAAVGTWRKGKLAEFSTSFPLIKTYGQDSEIGSGEECCGGKGEHEYFHGTRFAGPPDLMIGFSNTLVWKRGLPMSGPITGIIRMEEEAGRMLRL